jgi:hypothetical protein
LIHQNDSFNWQTYTRSEAEDLWVSLFPDQSYRDTMRSQLTSFSGKVYNKLFTDYAWGRPSASPSLRTEDALARAFIAATGPGVLGDEDRLNHWPNDSRPSQVTANITTPDQFEAGLRTITAREAPFARFVPNVVHVRLGGDQLYTLLAVRGYSNDKIAIGEASARRPEHDTIVAIPGFAAYEAHLFIDLPYANASGFLNELSAVTDQSAWNRFSARYKIGRNSPAFWPFVDWMHHWLEQNMPSRAALLELRVYDKDEKPF